ncbi:DUF2971 domain-containing protein [Bowmanella denitrificans]|uniref:DUF2971 domain-containing protein n=1 Tax=Bowmanella denitrificans TaxID=366582 RepID=UPI000C9A66B8|nr:DUF2971 domain-containing protein [Bowmanella denitrificans]
MRVYHFLNEQYGLEAIANAKLKVGRLSHFNDPFEYFHLETENCGTRDILKGRRKRANWDYGIICFSKNCTSPVQWSHYSDSHKGLCLGFDIPAEKLLKIEYIAERASAKDFKESLALEKEEFLKYMLSKKYKHWEYEEEHRLLIKFPQRNKGNDLVFEDFSENLKLKEVIIGFRSQVTKKILKKYLYRDKDVEIRKVYPSHNDYRMEIRV